MKFYKISCGTINKHIYEFTLVYSNHFQYIYSKFFVIFKFPCPFFKLIVFRYFANIFLHPFPKINVIPTNKL